MAADGELWLRDSSAGILHPPPPPPPVRVSLQGEPSLPLLIYSLVFVAAGTQGSCPILWVTTSYYLCQCSKGPTFDGGGAITETAQGTPAWATYVSEITGQSGGPGSDGALSCLGQMIPGCLPPALEAEPGRQDACVPTPKPGCWVPARFVPPDLQHLQDPLARRDSRSLAVRRSGWSHLAPACSCVPGRCRQTQAVWESTWQHITRIIKLFAPFDLAVTFLGNCSKRKFQKWTKAYA